MQINCSTRQSFDNWTAVKKTDEDVTKQSYRSLPRSSSSFDELLATIFKSSFQPTKFQEEPARIPLINEPGRYKRASSTSPTRVLPADGTPNPSKQKETTPIPSFAMNFQRFMKRREEGGGEVAGLWLIQTKLGGRDSFCKDPFEKTAAHRLTGNAFGGGEGNTRGLDSINFSPLSSALVLRIRGRVEIQRREINPAARLGRINF